MSMSLYEYLELSELEIPLQEDYEPGKDDISFIIEAARMIPKNQQELDNNNPEQLASYCLGAYQRTSELLAKATIWMGYQKIALDAVYGLGISASDEAATIRKEIVKSTDKYVATAQRFEKAKAYVQFYTDSMSAFEKGHYWGKMKEQQNKTEDKMSGYEPHERVNKHERGEQPYEVASVKPIVNHAPSASPVEDVSL